MLLESSTRIATSVLLSRPALIPLLGAALTSWNGAARVFTLAAIGAGAIGLLASFFVQRAIVLAWSQMANVLEESEPQGASRGSRSA